MERKVELVTAGVGVEDSQEINEKYKKKNSRSETLSS
jgi:hypothetical protein